MIDVNLLNDNTVVDVNLQTDDISIDLDIDSVGPTNTFSVGFAFL